jgi:hypothetical protein
MTIGDFCYDNYGGNDLLFLVPPAPRRNAGSDIGRVRTI